MESLSLVCVHQRDLCPFSPHSFCQSLTWPGAWTWGSRGQLLMCCGTQTPGGPCGQENRLALHLALLTGWAWALRHTMLAAGRRTPQAGCPCFSQDAGGFVLMFHPSCPEGGTVYPLKFLFSPNGSFLRMAKHLSFCSMRPGGAFLPHLLLRPVHSGHHTEPP